MGVESCRAKSEEDNGVSADGGWARESHVPAVQKLAGMELAAVSSKSQAKSDAARVAFSLTIQTGFF
jgi:hypothetical protein